MRVAREEIFGPVVTVLRYGSLDEAVQIVNNMSYGLGGVIVSSDPERALAVADRVDTGSVGVNFFASNHNAPFGGRHDCGLGVEDGGEGVLSYVACNVIHRPF